MTTVREARIAAARQAIADNGWEQVINVPESDLEDLAAHVVDALFPADPFLDNAQVPSVPDAERHQDWPGFGRSLC